MADRIEKNWEYYGAENAYYAVVSVSEFRDENVNDNALKKFFATGEEYVEKIWRVLEEDFSFDSRPQRALDFGCGVGRLTIPLAKKCESIVGVDIAESMVVEARRNCEQRGVANAEFVKGDDTLFKVTGKFDFIHSFIVFQHIVPTLGENLLRHLLGKLNEGGIGVLQFTYRDKSSKATKMRVKLYRKFPFIYKIRNIVTGAKQEPLIPMNIYNLSNIFTILRENDCHKCSLRFSDHGYDGAVLFFKKEKLEIL